MQSTITMTSVAASEHRAELRAQADGWRRGIAVRHGRARSKARFSIRSGRYFDHGRQGQRGALHRARA